MLVERLVNQSMIIEVIRFLITLLPFSMQKVNRLEIEPLVFLFQLSQNLETASLAVTLLLTTSEEMANPREDLSISRKQELQQLLLENMPSILSALSG